MKQNVKDNQKKQAVSQGLGQNITQINAQNKQKFKVNEKKIQKITKTSQSTAESSNDSHQNQNIKKIIPQQKEGQKMDIENNYIDQQQAIKGLITYMENIQINCSYVENEKPKAIHAKNKNKKQNSPLQVIYEADEPINEEIADPNYSQLEKIWKINEVNFILLQKYQINKPILSISTKLPMNIWRTRTYLINWMHEVIYAYNCITSQETFFRATTIMDLYLTQLGQNSKLEDLQLIGIVSIFIASKFEDMYSITLYDLVVHASHNKYTMQIFLFNFGKLKQQGNKQQKKKQKY